MSYAIESGKETGLVQANVVPTPVVLCQISAINPATGFVDSGSDEVFLSTLVQAGSNTFVYNGDTYLACLQSNIIDQIQSMSAQGFDIPGSATLKIADGGFSIWTNHASVYPWRGGTLTAILVLYDVPSDTFSTNGYTWTFTLDKPEIDGTGVLTVEAIGISMSRLSVPNFARQNRCGNRLPATIDQRLDGLTNPWSPYWGCGYSPDLSGGIGNTTTANLKNPDGSPLTDSSGIYVVCDYTRSCGAGKTTLTQGCMARLGNYSGTLAVDGDITKDTSGRTTSRFTGDTWVAKQEWTGRQYTNPGAGTQYGFNTPNPATGAVYYNQGYGTQWVSGTVLSPAGEPNSDRAEVIVCMAPVTAASILDVVVNGEEVQQNSGDVLFTYRVYSSGGRSGAVNSDALYNSQGDPHGSQCYIEAVIPTELATPGSVPQVQILVQFPAAMRCYPVASQSSSPGHTTLTLPSGVANTDVVAGMTVFIQGDFGLSDPPALVVASATSGPPGTITVSGILFGPATGVFYFPSSPDPAMVETATGAVAENPVWALMDLMTVWGPYSVEEVDAAAFYAAAQFCRGSVSYTTISGGTSSHARYRCSLAFTNDGRMSMAKAVLGIRNCAGLILGKNPTNGFLQCFVEGTLADTQPLPIAGSNYNIPVASYSAGGNATLAGNITSGAGSLTMSYAMPLVVGQVIKINSELIQITGGIGTASPTISRGFNSTTPASHTSGATIQPCGYLAYLFDGNGSIEKETFKLGGRKLNDTPNTVAFGFQDSANRWVQDTLTTVDQPGYVTSGNQEVAVPLEILGIDNFDQGTRRSNIGLAKSLYGNKRFDAGGTELPQFRTSAKAAHLAGRSGLLVGIRYDQLSL